MKASRQLSDSKHFRLQQLADGVYAAIHITGGAAIGNAGIVDLGDRTLVYDTLFTPKAAEDLRAAAEALTGRPIGTAINSHWHNDHSWGNQALDASTEILSTEETRRLIIATRGHGAFETFGRRRCLYERPAFHRASPLSGWRRSRTIPSCLGGSLKPDTQAACARSRAGRDSGRSGIVGTIHP